MFFALLRGCFYLFKLTTVPEFVSAPKKYLGFQQSQLITSYIFRLRVSLLHFTVSTTSAFLLSLIRFFVHLSWWLDILLSSSLVDLSSSTSSFYKSCFSLFGYESVPFFSYDIFLYVLLLICTVCLHVCLWVN